MQLHNLAPRPRPRPRPPPSPLQAAPARPGPGSRRVPVKPVQGRVRAPEPGSAPAGAVLCPRPSAAGAGAPGRGRGARGAPLTFRCLQISRGRCSAWLEHVSPRTRASLARHGALRTGHPRRGSPGSRGGRLGSGDLAGCAPAARPLHRRRPGPAGPRAAARVPPAPLSDAREEAAARPAPGTPARSLARGAAEPATATRLRAPPMSSFTAIVFGEISEQGPGGGGGAGEGAGGKSLPLLPGPSYSAEPGGRRTGRLSRAPAACAPGWHRGGRSPGPRGAGAGAARGPAACVGWGNRRERRGPRPPTPEPEPEPEEEVDGAAGGCRLRAGLHRGASSGFLGCRRRCAARELVEPTLEPPPEQPEGGDPRFSLGRGRWGPRAMAACGASRASPAGFGNPGARGT